MPPGAFVFGPRPVAVVSVLVAIACLGTLVIVATQKNVDALSTIALAVAILAFAAQLIIYIAQAETSNRQLYLSQVVQAETARMLAGIEAQTQAHLDALNRAIPRLVETAAAAEHAAAESASEDEGEAPLDPDVLREQLSEIVRDELARAQASPSWAPLISTYALGRGAASYIDRSDPRSYGATTGIRVPADLANAARYGLTDPAIRVTEPFTYVKGTEDRSKVREDPSKTTEPPVEPPA